MIRIFIITFLFFSIHLSAQSNFTQAGKASYYADKFEGNYTASGEKYSHRSFTAAHLTLPFNTTVRVTNASNGKSVVVRINDRGPFIKGRIIDLSKSAANEIGLNEEIGVTNVIIEVTNEDTGNIPGDLTLKETDKGNNVTEEKDTNTDETLGDNKENITEIAKSIDTKEVYSISVNKITGKNYGVQVGSYQESANFVRTVEALNSKFGDNVFLVISNVNDQKIYKVVVGSYQDRKQADVLKKKMNKEYEGCFVIEM
ncbi:septal ring lytic transglycosylase RlpA family protein [Bacteroidales bacterium]|nr:septal ring lytic transglycosylase RlpA family protein [Bacteroidales bacterium]